MATRAYAKFLGLEFIHRGFRSFQVGIGRIVYRRYLESVASCRCHLTFVKVTDKFTERVGPAFDLGPACPLLLPPSPSPAGTDWCVRSSCSTVTVTHTTFFMRAGSDTFTIGCGNQQQPIIDPLLQILN